MKKIIRLGFLFTLLSSLICCVGCHKNTDHIDWNDNIGTYQHPVIPNEEVAVSVANQIFKGMIGNELRENYVPQRVIYDEVDEIWVVSFWANDDTDDKIITVGGDCSIAIRKEDGKVLKIWFGE